MRSVVRMDYLFYKIYAYYKRKNYIPVMMGIYFLLVLQICCLFLLGTILNLTVDGILSNQNKGFNKEHFYTVYFFIVVFLFVLNILRYSRKKRVQALESRFKDRRGLKTWQVFILPVLMVFFSILIIVLFRG